MLSDPQTKLAAQRLETRSDLPHTVPQPPQFAAVSIWVSHWTEGSSSLQVRKFEAQVHTPESFTVPWPLQVMASENSHWLPAKPASQMEQV